MRMIIEECQGAFCCVSAIWSSFFSGGCSGRYVEWEDAGMRDSQEGSRKGLYGRKGLYRLVCEGVIYVVYEIGW